MHYILHPQFFPVVIVALSALACIRYAVAGVLGDNHYWGNALYWLCVVGVNIAATWLMKH